MSLEQSFCGNWLNKRRSIIKLSREVYMSYNPFDSDSPSFGGLGGYGNEEELGSWKKAWEIEKPKPVDFGELHKDFSGHSWGRSFEPTDLIMKPTPLGTLHIHCTGDGLLTGAKLFTEYGEKKISNYEAAMLDLGLGISKKKKGFGEW
jgi:hypothetical protein